MKGKGKANIVNAVGLILLLVSVVAAQEYEGLKGVERAKAVFDVRLGNPKSAAIHLKLIHQTFKDLAGE